MEDHVTIDEACVFAWGTMESDKAIDAIVYAVAADERFPVEGGGPVTYAAFYRVDGHPVLHGVYRSDEAAQIALAQRHTGQHSLETCWQCRVAIMGPQYEDSD